ncbi:MAG: SpoIID/LytB domain-containing protein [Bacilli bacterium]
MDKLGKKPTEENETLKDDISKRRNVNRSMPNQTFQNNQQKHNPLQDFRNGVNSVKNVAPALQNLGKGMLPPSITGRAGGNPADTDQRNKKKSLSDRQNDEEANEEEPKEKSASDEVVDAAKNLIAGGGKPPKDAPESIQLAYKMKIIYKVCAFLAPAMPFILTFVAIIITAVLIMSQIMILRDKINDGLITVTTGIEKFINLGSGEGWATEEEVFYKTLKTEFEDAAKLPTKDGKVLELDIPLIAATINYSKVTDVGVYEDANGKDLGEELDGSAEGAFGDYFASYIDTFQMRNFYYIANDKLGDYNTLAWGKRRLLGHMVTYDVEWGTYGIMEAIDNWKNMFSLIGDSADETLSDISESIPLIPDLSDPNPFSFIFNAISWGKTVSAYHFAGDQHDGYFKYQVRNMVYEFEEFMFKMKGLDETKDSNGNSYTTNESDYYDVETGEETGFFSVFPAPKVTYRLTTDEKKPFEYGDYLNKVYLPGTFMSKETYKEETVKRMTNEIFAQKEYYLYLVGDLGKTFTGSNGQNCNDCTYNLLNIINSAGSSISSPNEDYANVNNIKVKLLTYYGSPKGEVMKGAESIDFEKYILGVTYAEVGDGQPDEAWKCEAIAARSYSLARPFSMGNTKYTNWSKSGDNWILTLRGSTADHVYCDPDQGCSSDSRNFNSADIFPGLDHASQYKGPLDSLPDKGEGIRNAVGATAGQVIINDDGKVVEASYLNTDQNEWTRRANAGEKYTSILPSHYTNKIGINISVGNGNCTKSDDSSCMGEMTGEWQNWRQFDEPWGSKYIGSGTMAHYGCAVTSVAMQLARSKTELKFSNLNPGTFLDAYKQAGGFDGDLIYFDQINKVAPKFNYQGTVALSGDQVSKYDKVKEYLLKGYYIVLHVNNNQHYVAVVKTEKGEIHMADPAKAATGVFSTYGANSVTEFLYYKVG